MGALLQKQRKSRKSRGNVKIYLKSHNFEKRVVI